MLGYIYLNSKNFSIIFIIFVIAIAFVPFKHPYLDFASSVSFFKKWHTVFLTARFNS